MSDALRNPWILDTVSSLINPSAGSEIGQSTRTNWVTQVIDADESNVGLILLSDKRHFVWAKLSEKCVQKLRSERSRLSASFASLKGALLNVSKFTVCMDFLRDSPDVAICEYSLSNALHLGYAGRSLALHLRVEELDLIGCDSLSICGNPKNVCSDSGVVPVLRRTSPEVLHRKLVKLQSVGNSHKCPHTIDLPLFGNRRAQRYDICSTTQYSDTGTPEENEEDVNRAFGPPAEVTFAPNTVASVVNSPAREAEKKTQSSVQTQSQKSLVSSDEILNSQAFINTQHNGYMTLDEEDDLDCNGGTSGISTQAFLSTPTEDKKASKPPDDATQDERVPFSKKKTGSADQQLASRKGRRRIPSVISIKSDSDSDEEVTQDNTAKLKDGGSLPSVVTKKVVLPKKVGHATADHTGAGVVQNTSIQAKRVVAKPPSPTLVDQSAQTLSPTVVSKDIQTVPPKTKDSETQTRLQLCNKAVQTMDLLVEEAPKWTKPKSQLTKRKRKFSQLNLTDIKWVASYFTKASRRRDE